VVVTLETQAVSESQPFDVQPVPPTDRDAQRLLWVYFGELVSRYQGRPGTDQEIRESMVEDPSDDLVAPTGVLLLGRMGTTAVGCIGLRLRPHRVGQVTRMFVMASVRRHGLGFRLLDELEGIARNQGITRLEVDTRDDLVEARGLYERYGFEEVPAFNSGPYAEHWFVKNLER
jgi:GNAT superfamily N-acetyltransferase